ncbi:MAG: hypothetical protein GY749_38445 [Desulfobacteraceae bacterium]|nr:hypothetical protein [Desulfobacteraceae bacterium]
MENHTDSKPKINVFALPNQTTVIFVLIVTVVLGAVFSGLIGAAITNVPILWMFPLALFILPLRAFIARPKRDFSRYKLWLIGNEFADLQNQIDSFALKTGLPKIPRLAISDCLLKKGDIHTFGTFRHWYIPVNRDDADFLEKQLKNPETTLASEALLFHELYHFKTGDYWQLGYVRELVRITSFFTLWALVFFLGFCFLLYVAKCDVINFVPLAEWINQIPAILQKLFELFNIMEMFRQKLQEADPHQHFLFYITVTCPFIIMGLFLWGIYYPKLWRVRELYADAGAIHEQKDSLPLISSITGIPLSILKNYPNMISNQSNQFQKNIWSRIRGLWSRIRKFHPPSHIRLETVKNPSLVFENWKRTAWLAGSLAIVLEFSLSTPLTAVAVGKIPIHFLTLAVLIFVYFNYLIPHIAQGEPVKCGLLKIVFWIMLLRLLVTFLMLSMADPELLKRLDIAGPSKAPPFHDAEYLVSQLIITGYVQVVAISFVLLGSLASVALLLRRIFVWYAFQHCMIRFSYWTAIISVSVFLSLTVLPLIMKVLSYPLPLFHLASFNISTVVLGIIVALAGLIIFWYADKKYAHRCPECGKMIYGSYKPGMSCCEKLLHDWLIAEHYK